MAAAIDVARRFLRLAWNDGKADALTHARLQRLLYYVQGWHLASFGAPLFDDPIQAWDCGPVVKDVYTAFAGKAGAIPPAEAGEDRLTGRDRLFVDATWGEYKDFTAPGLRDAAHPEPLWAEARAGLSNGQSGEREIGREAMRSHFAGLLQERLIPGLSVEETYRMVEEAGRKRGRPHADVFAGLRGRRP